MSPLFKTLKKKSKVFIIVNLKIMAARTMPNLILNILMRKRLSNRSRRYRKKFRKFKRK